MPLRSAAWACVPPSDGSAVRALRALRRYPVKGRLRTSSRPWCPSAASWDTACGPSATPHGKFANAKSARRFAHGQVFVVWGLIRRRRPGRLEAMDRTCSASGPRGNRLPLR